MQYAKRYEIQAEHPLDHPQGLVMTFHLLSSIDTSHESVPDGAVGGGGVRQSLRMHPYLRVFVFADGAVILEIGEGITDRFHLAFFGEQNE